MYIYMYIYIYAYCINVYNVQNWTACNSTGVLKQHEIALFSAGCRGRWTKGQSTKWLLRDESQTDVCVLVFGASRLGHSWHVGADPVRKESQ